MFRFGCVGAGEIVIHWAVRPKTHQRQYNATEPCKVPLSDFVFLPKRTRPLFLHAVCASMSRQDITAAKPSANDFEAMSLNRIEATLSPENAASMRVLERLGFVREGHFLQHGYPGPASITTASNIVCSESAGQATQAMATLPSSTSRQRRLPSHPKMYLAPVSAT